MLKPISNSASVAVEAVGAVMLSHSGSIASQCQTWNVATVK